MGVSLECHSQYVVVFFILFSLIIVSEAGYANPPDMKAPWPEGMTIGCNQGNYGPTHNIPFTYYSWDFDLPMGTQVLAVADGTVSLAGFTGRDGYGNQLRIKHPNRSCSLYAHLDSHAVMVGQRVRQGQLIGYCGVTGYTFGPHLHFSIIDQKNFSLPSRFVDIGIPETGGFYTSRNVALRCMV